MFYSNKKGAVLNNNYFWSLFSASEAFDSSSNFGFFELFFIGALVSLVPALRVLLFLGVDEMGTFSWVWTSMPAREAATCSQQTQQLSSKEGWKSGDTTNASPMSSPPDHLLEQYG